MMEPLSHSRMLDKAAAKSRRKPRLRRWLGFGALFFLLFLLLDFGSICLEVWSLSVHDPKTSAFIQRYLKTCSNPCPFYQSWKPLGEISKNLQEAVLISEDDAFFEHEGIDPEAIKESIELNLKKKKFARGGSTLTQQLAKNLYLSPSKNPWRKAKEILLAMLMEKMISKQRILEIYLNVIEWGKGIYGAQAASEFYFKKDASALSAPEAAYLSAIIPNPGLYTSAWSRRAQGRRNIILKRMGYRNFEELNGQPKRRTLQAD